MILTRLFRPRTLLVFIVAAGLIIAPVGDASAKKKRHKKGEYSTKVDVRSVTDTGVLKGMVQSNTGSCVEGRKVRVERNGERIGSVAADDAGEWVVETNGNLENGDRIIAKVDRVKITKTNKAAGQKGKGGNKKPSKNKKGGGKKKSGGKTKKKSFCAADISGPFDLNRLNVGVTGAGTVISTPGGISCRETSGVCSALFGSTNTFIDAHADQGSQFSGYTGDCNTVNPHCDLVMDTERNVNATFTAAGGGSTCILDAIPTLGPIICRLLGFPSS